MGPCDARPGSFVLRTVTNSCLSALSWRSLAELVVAAAGRGEPTVWESGFARAASLGRDAVASALLAGATKAVSVYANNVYLGSLVTTIPVARRSLASAAWIAASGPLGGKVIKGTERARGEAAEFLSRALQSLTARWPSVCGASGAKAGMTAEVGAAATTGVGARTVPSTNALQVAAEKARALCLNVARCWPED